MYGLNQNLQYAPFTTFTPYNPGYGASTAAYGVYTPYAAPYTAPFASSYAQGAFHGTATPDLNFVLARIEEVRSQVIALNEMIRLDLIKRQAGTFGINTLNGLHTLNGVNSFAGLNGINSANGLNSINGLNSFNGFNGLNPINGLNTFNGAIESNNPIRLRESDSHIFMDVYLPQLTMGDVDVEVSGNRIVCRTRVPVAMISRIWANSQIPRGFELYELADGRVEFSWIAPVAFQAKEVEATWREGYLCVCIPKAEVAPRHNVKVVRETVSNRKAASDMNS